MNINEILKEELLKFQNTEIGIGDQIDEKIIQLGKKLYPLNNNVVLFAGGSGSGKGFVKDNLLGIEGKVFDADELKSMFLRNVKLRKELKDIYGFDVDGFDFKNPDHVDKLHMIIKNKGVPENRIEAFKQGVLSLQNKPNIIFDTTLSDFLKFNYIIQNVISMGYTKENIHIVWVLTDYETALQNNKNRSRVVSDVIFDAIHKGVSRTMKDILNMSDNLDSLMDGDIHLVFNNPNEDTKDVRPDGFTKPSKKGLKTFGDTNPHYVKEANYIKLKEAGRPLKGYNEISQEIIDKINRYVPSMTKW